MKPTKIDSAIYITKDENVTIGLCGSYLDDYLNTGIEQFQKEMDLALERFE